MKKALLVVSLPLVLFITMFIAVFNLVSLVYLIAFDLVFPLKKFNTKIIFNKQFLF